MITQNCSIRTTPIKIGSVLKSKISKDQSIIQLINILLGIKRIKSSLHQGIQPNNNYKILNISSSFRIYVTIKCIWHFLCDVNCDNPYYYKLTTLLHVSLQSFMSTCSKSMCLWNVYGISHVNCDNPYYNKLMTLIHVSLISFMFHMFSTQQISYKQGKLDFFMGLCHSGSCIGKVC